LNTLRVIWGAASLVPTNRAIPPLRVPMVSRLLKDLEKGGYIELGIRRITLLKKLPSRW